MSICMVWDKQWKEMMVVSADSRVTCDPFH